MAIYAPRTSAIEPSWEHRAATAHDNQTAVLMWREGSRGQVAGKVDA